MAGPWYCRLSLIVSCSQCHTRFKVPDAKVSPRGRKVRCSRCGHTFRVHPEPHAKPADPSAQRVDPFAQFGPAGSSDLEATPTVGFPVEALLARAEAPPGPASPTERPVAAPPPAARGSSDDFDVDDSGEGTPRAAPAWNFPPAPSADSTPSGATPLGREVPALVPLPVRPLPADLPEAKAPNTFDPFSDLGDVQASGAPDPLGLADLEPEPPPRKRKSPGDSGPPVPRDVSAPAASADGVGPAAAAEVRPPGTGLAALSGLTPAWGIAGPARSLAADGTLSRDEPTGAEAVDEAPPPPPSFASSTELDDLPSLGDLGPTTVGSLELDEHPEARGWSGASPLNQESGQLELPEGLAALELDRSAEQPLPVPGPSWAAAPAATRVPEALGGGATPYPGLSWEPPAPVQAPAALSAGSDRALDWDDPFADPPAAPPPARRDSGVQAPSELASSSVPLDEPTSATGRDHALFDMSAPRAVPAASAVSSSAEPLLPDIPDALEPAALDPIAAPITGPIPVARLSRPPRRTQMGLDDRGEPGAARRLTAVALNVGIAGLLLLVLAGLGTGYVNEGRLDWSVLSPRRWLSVLGSRHGVAPTDLTNGLYETRSGHPVLYLRGRVQNHGEPTARIRVRAELWDSGRRMKTGETVAGASATPEELWKAGTAAEVEALRQKLLASATPVSDGRSAEFLIVFDEPPADLAGLRLRVLASIEPEARARSGPEQP
jgi:predicted Zn finger-like uncharacterized protein